MHITLTKCRNCELKFKGRTCGYMYVRADDGKRICCPHPGEYSTVERVTGMDGDEARAIGRVGHISHCMCFQCLHQFELDLDRDMKQCPECKSLDVKSAYGALGCECPQCHTGVLYEHDTGVRS